MTSTNLARFDKQTRAELGVHSSAWLRQVTPSKLEVRVAGNPDPLATAIFGEGHWAVSGPQGVTFTSDPLMARRLLWAASTAPPAPARAPQRKGFDYYNSRGD